MKDNLVSNNTNNTYKWLITFLSGLFMFIVLYFYRAYHIDQVPAFTGHSMFFRALTHSTIISIVFFIIEFYVSQHLQVNDKVKPIITALIATFLGLNLTFLTFNYFYHWTELHWSSYSKFLYEYPLILIFPVTVSILIDRLTGRSGKWSNNIITISSENNKEHFQIKADNLLFIKSADNYVEIFYLTMQQVKKHLLRKKLKDIEKEHLSCPFLIRCHRSFMVNPANIDHLNKTNSNIELNISGITIPVSKKYVPSLSLKIPHLFTTHLEISSQID